LRLAAIIVAAGSSTRAGFDKLFAELAGRPLIQYSLDAFEGAASVDEMVVVCREPSVAITELIASTKLKKVRVVRGGERRQDSVQAGFDACSASANFVAVHDAARPLIVPREIERVFRAAQRQGAAVLASPVTDTLKLADANQLVCGSIERENVFAMQTPQIFARQLLLDAYERVRRELLTITDEVSAVQLLGAKVEIVPAEEQNMKVTFAGDLVLAETILRQRQPG
jgi:2-C-methyl-D-erythritol 4-phosphate cytidylyltransferase